MFTGRYYHNLESKGRLAIPRTFRPELASGGYLTTGLDGCLFLFPESYWQQLAEKLASLPLTNPASRQIVRLFAQSATVLNFDSQGRILIPLHLLESAHLQKQVVVAGSLNRVEIWDRDLYHQHLDMLNQDTNLLNSLSEYGI